MATVTAHLTLDEFIRLPDPPSGHYELHHGETVLVPPPKFIHTIVQRRLLGLLQDHLDHLGLLTIEFPFRAGNLNFRIADVGFGRADRVRSSYDQDYFSGSPDLVIEVLSPTNTAQEISDGERLCLEHGCLQFWVVDSHSRTVKVSTPDRLTRTYLESDVLSLSPIAEGEVAIAEIFQSL